MQKRYCHCGQELYVYYITKAAWSPKYWYIESLQHGETVSTCPHCGCSLHIDVLD